MYIGLTHALLSQDERGSVYLSTKMKYERLFMLLPKKGELIFFSAQNEEGPKVKQERLRVHLVVRGGSISC